jgi:hypothetical protein
LEYVTQNTLLHDRSGLPKIWRPWPPALPQYYPLTFSSYWLEYQIWGTKPQGYHLTNVVLHATASLLIVPLARRLGASDLVAFGAAAAFALHPVQVESVAWVAERKNVLSGLFYVLSLLLYIRHRRCGGWTSYLFSVLLFAGALLSKTQTLTLPVAMLLVERLLPREAGMKPIRSGGLLLRIAPMMALALAAAVLTAAVERAVGTPLGETPSVTERPFLVFAAICFYVSKFMLPIFLAPMYPKWEITPTDPKWWLAPVACVFTLTLAFRKRASIPPPVQWGTAQFLVSLLPVIGVIPFTYQNFSYVADRFLYLSCIGGALAAACLAARMATIIGRRRLVLCAAAATLICYALASHEIAGRWRTNLSFWRYTLERNPQAYHPNFNLAYEYASRGQWSEAVPFAEKALQARPNNSPAFRLYVRVLRTTGGPRAVVDLCTARLRSGTALAPLVLLARAQSFEELGDTGAAMSDYEQVLRMTREGSSSWLRAQGRIKQLRSLGTAVNSG